tara:strand:- start:1402 stop:1833 length:432 start_codon:yes stop_codon:yes gene_type:complete
MAGKSGIRKPYKQFTKRNIPKLCQELLEYLEPLLLQRGIELDFGRIRFTGEEIILETRIIKEGSMSVQELQVESNTPYTTGDILDIPGAGLVTVIGYTRYNLSKPLLVLDSAGEQHNIPVFPRIPDTTWSIAKKNTRKLQISS